MMTNISTRKLECLRDSLMPGKLYQTPKSVYAFPTIDSQLRFHNNALPAYTTFMFVKWQCQTYRTTSGEELDSFMATLNILVGKYTYVMNVYDGIDYDFRQII